MGRFTDLLEGTNLTEKATSEAHDTDSGTFNYFQYVRTDGSYVIMREKTDETEYRFFVGNDSIAGDWTNRSSHTYSTPNNFKNA